MAADLPICRNRDCPTYKSNKGVVLGKETDTEFVFCCRNCMGMEVRTKPNGWKRAAMEESYRVKGRPEYARVRAFFDLGRR